MPRIRSPPYSSVLLTPVSGPGWGRSARRAPPLDGPVKPQGCGQRDGVHDGLHPHTAVQGKERVHEIEQQNVQYTLAQDRADQGLPGPAHGLELDDHGITQGHHGHCRHHAPQEHGPIADCRSIGNEQGECSCTGLHGGNRLASNSLIEAVVYADAAAKHSLQVVDQYSYNEDIPEWNDEGTRSPEEMVLITQSMKEVNQIMSTYVGIVRSDLRLKRAWDRLDIIYEETESLFKRSVASREICELRNMVNVGYLIMRQAMERKESRGLHYTIDYPHVKK